MSAAMRTQTSALTVAARRTQRITSRRPNHQLFDAGKSSNRTRRESRLRPAAVVTPPSAPSPGPTRTDAERRAEEALLAGDESDGTIAGFTKLEWSCIQTPARYLGNEVGARHKDWDDAQVRFTMAYPEIYEVGASNLGHVVLYTILNNQPGMLCDRAYLPGDDMLQLLKSKNRDLFAVESKRPLKHFDALGMSLAYELGAVNVLEMMHLSGVPLTWKERDDEPGEVWDVENGCVYLLFVFQRGRAIRLTVCFVCVQVLALGVHRRSDGDVESRARRGLCRFRRAGRRRGRHGGDRGLFKEVQKRTV